MDDSHIPDDPTRSSDAVKELMDRIKQMNKDFKASLATKRYNMAYRDLIHPDEMTMLLHRAHQPLSTGPTHLEITCGKVRTESDNLYTFDADGIKNVIRSQIDKQSDKEP